MSGFRSPTDRFGDPVGDDPRHRPGEPVHAVMPDEVVGLSASRAMRGLRTPDYDTRVFVGTLH